MSAETTQTEALAAENRRLKGEVARLQDELLQTEAWANRAVAEAQAKVYWLDRWHVDLNELMRRHSADRIRAAARGMRSVYRRVLRLRRALLP